MAQKIEIVRGTTNDYRITVTDAEGRLYATATNEKIIFGVKKDPEDAEPIFAKVARLVAVGIYSVSITPADTVGLDPGRYFYDVALQSGDKFYNIIEPNHFIIQANITSWGCAE